MPTRILVLLSVLTSMACSSPITHHRTTTPSPPSAAAAPEVAPVAETPTLFLVVAGQPQSVVIVDHLGSGALTGISATRVIATEPFVITAFGDEEDMQGENMRIFERGRSCGARVGGVIPIRIDTPADLGFFDLYDAPPTTQALLEQVRERGLRPELLARAADTECTEGFLAVEGPIVRDRTEMTRDSEPPADLRERHAGVLEDVLTDAREQDYRVEHSSERATLEHERAFVISTFSVKEPGCGFSGLSYYERLYIEERGVPIWEDDLPWNVLAVFDLDGDGVLEIVTGTPFTTRGVFTFDPSMPELPRSLDAVVLPTFGGDC